MPSPVTSSAAQPDPALDIHLQNGTNGERAVQQPDATNTDDGPQASADGAPDIIREGKEKAKAVMAASGLAVDNEVAQTSASGKENASPTASGTVNGTSPSRKRSRSGSRIPSQTPAQDGPKKDAPSMNEVLLDHYMTQDMLHYASVADQLEESKSLMEFMTEEERYYKLMAQHRQQFPGTIYGAGYKGYGNGATEVKPSRLQYPAQRKRLGNRRSRPIQMTRKDGTAQAEQLEELVPVRLDIELEKIKLRDTFTWNLHDRVTPPELFAENMVEDFNPPPEVRVPLTQQIIREMHEQILEFYPHAYIQEEALDQQLPYHAYKDDEMRILIKLNITIGQHTLVDQFEWEINNPLNSPEEFARQMTRELSLSGEFTTAIAHDIREQCQMFTKSLYITGHPFDGRPIDDADVRDAFLPSPIPSVFRPMQSAKDYGPYLYELSEQELDRAELSILREQRRQKRSVNRRGGPALPDLKDRQRTVRTLIVSTVLPGAAEQIEESHIFKISRTSGRRRPAVNDGDDSDESDSEISGAESPAPSQITGGTARTRNMRGAAAAAQTAMRATIGRSATPEVATLHHHETRTSRRFPTSYETREESVPEPVTLIVKLKINPKRFKEWLQNPKPKSSGDAAQRSTSTPVMTPKAPPQRSTPSASTMPPPPSPAPPSRSTPTAGTPSTENGPKYYPDGRADAPYPLPPGTTPVPPPQWLQTALQELREKYPNHLFEAVMRYLLVDTNKNEPVKLEQPAPATLPSHVKAQYLPRIKCLDCPGKAYTPGPALSVENFEVHLKNRAHIGNVEKRVGKSAAS